MNDKEAERQKEILLEEEVILKQLKNIKAILEMPPPMTEKEV